MGRRDWRIRPTEQSLEPPDDEEPDAADVDAEDLAMSRREDEEVESFMEDR
jgi:hypothetical protein